MRISANDRRLRTNEHGSIRGLVVSSSSIGGTENAAQFAYPPTGRRDLATARQTGRQS
jgi:hypothetical protein